MKATDLVVTRAQDPSDLKLEPQIPTLLTEENLEEMIEEMIEEKTEEKRSTHTSHLLAQELDHAVAPLATDDVPGLLLLETGETCFQAVQDHHLADSPLEEMTELVRHRDADHARPTDVDVLPTPSDLEITHRTHETRSANALLHQIAATIGHDLLPDGLTHHLEMQEEEATDQGLAHLQESQLTRMTIGDHDLRLLDQILAIHHVDLRLLSTLIVPA